MTWTQAPPPPARPTDQRWDVRDVRVSLPEAVGKLPDPTVTVQAAAVRGIDGVPWYQIYVAGEATPRYVNATTGALDPARDEAYAAQIAGNALGGLPVRKTKYLTDYDHEYINIFRLLPVYRFDCDDGKGTRVYVSTVTGSVARHTDDRSQWEAWIFWNFHKLGFITNKPVRDAVLTAMTGGILVVAVLGIVLFFASRPRNRR
jgi:hypothetical protein